MILFFHLLPSQVIDGNKLVNSETLRCDGTKLPENQQLKIYMTNQLDLQQAEWENYENVINNLLNRIEAAEQRNHELNTNFHRLLEKEEKYKIRIKLLERSHDQMKQVDRILFVV